MSAAQRPEDPGLVRNVVAGTETGNRAMSAAAQPVTCPPVERISSVATDQNDVAGNEAAAARQIKRQLYGSEQHADYGNAKKIRKGISSAAAGKQQPCLLHRLVAADVRQDRNLLLQVFRCSHLTEIDWSNWLFRRATLC
jgi:hypothetical protein